MFLLPDFFSVQINSLSEEIAQRPWQRVPLSPNINGFGSSATKIPFHQGFMGWDGIYFEYWCHHCMAHIFQTRKCLFVCQTPISLAV